MDSLWSGVLVLNDFFRTFVRGGRARTSKEMDGTLKIGHDYPCAEDSFKTKSKSIPFISGALLLGNFIF